MVGALAGDLVDAGVRPERAGDLAIATSMMRVIMELLAVDDALIVDGGLREGVALAHYDDAQSMQSTRAAAQSASAAAAGGDGAAGRP